MTTTDVTSLTDAYRPGQERRSGMFIVLEGISGSGKSTLAALLARQLQGHWFHTVPAPVSDLQPYINTSARPLPQLAFYLAGALHASDLARDALRDGHVVADRYVNSVIANHAAIHGLDNDTVTAAIAPFTRYLVVPDMTVYLHTSTTELSRRMRAKRDQTRSDRDLLADPELLQRLQDRYDQVAATDPTARHLHATGRTPDELAGLILAMLPTVTGAR
jgi:thymidylate kinase